MNESERIIDPAPAQSNLNTPTATRIPVRAVTYQTGSNDIPILHEEDSKTKELMKNL